MAIRRLLFIVLELCLYIRRPKLIIWVSSHINKFAPRHTWPYLTPYLVVRRPHRPSLRTEGFASIPLPEVPIAQEVCGHDYVLESKGGERLHISSFHTLFFFRSVPIQSSQNHKSFFHMHPISGALHVHFSYL